MITLHDVTKRYDTVEAVKGISFTITSGEVVGLVGPNGAGKTTTMKMITGFIVPSEGRITIDDSDVVLAPHEAQAKIGYLPENNPLYPEMAVQDYLLFMAQMRGLSGGRLKERLHFAASKCGILDRLVRPIRTLSKGLRQRVGIAQAIIHDPAILILDEPTSGLDPNQIIEIRNLIKELGRDKTVILSTHILSEVEETCSRAIMIVGGRKAADDRIDKLAGSRTIRLAVETADDLKSKIAALDGVAGVTTANDGRAGVRSWRVTPHEGREIGKALWSLAVQQHWTVVELASDRRSLEDVFREVSVVTGGQS